MPNERWNGHPPRRRLIRILSLDGGGVRGLSSLYILRDLMQRIEATRREAVRPADCFELIIGTGTGGISALLLGRMRMTVDDAIQEYVRMAETAYKWSSESFRTSFWVQNKAPDGAALERAIGDVVEKFLGYRDAQLEDPSEGSMSCRTAVLAITSLNGAARPYLFRSYASHRPASAFAIHEVARATVSTTRLFPAISLGDLSIQSIDAGSTDYHNPAEVAVGEAAALWPGRPIDCLVSLGTGFQKNFSVGEGWSEAAQTCLEIMRSCEQVHDTMYRMSQLRNFAYFRFNVNRGLDGVGLLEWSEMGSRGDLAEVTGSYVRRNRVNDQVDKCLRLLDGEKIGELLYLSLRGLRLICSLVDVENNTNGNTERDVLLGQVPREGSKQISYRSEFSSI
jgi:hypothetical protein